MVDINLSSSEKDAKVFESRHPTSRFSAKNIVLVGIVLLLAYLTVVPLAFLVYVTFFPDAQFSVEGFRSAFVDRGMAKLLASTTIFAAGSSAISMVVGIGLAWYAARTNLPFKQLIFASALMPLVIPALLYGIAWVFLLQPRAGLLAGPINAYLGSDAITAYSMSAMIFVQGLDASPLVFLLLYAAFQTMDPSLEEAASLSGASTWQVFWRVTLPSARPAILGALLIVVVRNFEAFEIPSIMGTPANIYVFSTQIYRVLNFFPPRYSEAGGYSIVLLVVVGFVLFAQNRYLAGNKKFATVTGKGFRSREIVIVGNSRRVLAGFSLLYVLVAVALPLAVLIYSSLIPFVTRPTREVLGRMSLNAYSTVLSDSRISNAFMNSIQLALGSATLVMLVAAIAAWITIRSKVRGAWLVDNLAFVPFIVPGIVLGVALLFVYLRSPVPIFGTLWLLLIAYVTKFIPYGMRYAVPSIVKIHSELEEAATMSGATWLQTFRRILLPLMMPGMIAGWIYVAIIALRELSTSVLLYTPGNDVIAIQIFELWNDGRTAEVGATGVVLITISLVLVIIGRTIGRRDPGRKTPINT